MNVRWLLTTARSFSWRTRRVQLASSAHLWASKLRLRAANDADVSRRSATGMVRKSGGQLPGNAG